MTSGVVKFQQIFKLSTGASKAASLDGKNREASLEFDLLILHAERLSNQAKKTQWTFPTASDFVLSPWHS